MEALEGTLAAMKSRGLETARYSQLLIESTGDITVDVLDPEVTSHVVCGGVVGGGLVKTKLPPAYLSSVPAKSYAVTTHATGAELRFQADLGTYRAGFDPTCATVPTEATDPCVTDWDGDGAPGATIQVKIPMYAWTDVYVCQQNHILLDGVATSADRVEGGLEILDLQNSVIGATRSLFARSPSSTVVQSASTFTMARLATDAGCEQVLAIR